MEHRWGERLSVRTRVALRAHGGLRGIGYIHDVSISGALLVTGVRASPMSFVHVQMGPVSIEGQVVRHTDDGFAVEWCELAPEVVRAMARTEEPAAAWIERDIPAIVRSVSAGR